MKSDHITPKRRLTRQKSGFTVDGTHTGSESTIVRAQKVSTENRKIEMLFKQEGLKLIPQFGEQNGIVGFGIFIKTNVPSSMDINSEAGDSKSQTSFSLSRNTWSKIGTHLFIPLHKDLIDVNAKCSITIKALEKFSGLFSIELFGANLDSVDYYENREDLKKFFDEQTALYIPEIYYLEHDQSIITETNFADEMLIKNGEPLVLKACNRCGRFLPIDISNERNSLSFSNHCVKRSSCTHGAFSSYNIENLDEIRELLILEPIKSHLTSTNKIKTNYGFQLECRVCKKYVVNAQLNPLRNSAQHREDSSRRRAIEDLLLKLLEKQWIFKLFRMKNGSEFDDFIWNKFDQKCFNCGKLLKKTSEMALDHTMPLVYFWPLDETATCLCKTCNSKKHDYFPFEFYNQKQLVSLSKITKLPKDLLTNRTKTINKIAIDELTKRVVWFFNDFLAQKDYQKVREEKLTADLIYASIKRVLQECNSKVDLIKEYQDKMDKLPQTISLG